MSSEVKRRLIINLVNVAAWYLDREVGTLTVITDGVSARHPVPDEIIVMDGSIFLFSYTPDVTSEEIASALGMQA